MDRYQKFILLLSGLLLSTIGFAQNFEINSSLSASGFLASEEELPFWMVTNKNGALSSKTDGLFQATTEGTYSFSENNSAQVTVGASLFLRNGVEDKLQRNEIYLQFENSWLRAIIGAKNPIDRFQGLSVVDDNFLWSGNARAIPGVLLETATPIALFKNLSIEGGIGHYELNDDRYTKGAMIHYKKLYANWQINNKSNFTFGIEHYAVWGGISPDFGKQPSNFNAFIDVFLAKESNDETANVGDQVNALGNHLGIYNIEYTHEISTGELKLYHQHPFEDGSGTAFNNFPDGIWGLYYKEDKENYTSFLKGLLVEYITTVYQGGTDKERGGDNYFNNSIFRSGWRYEDNVIGFPFFERRQNAEYFLNNRYRGVHLGIFTATKKTDFKTKITYIENLGTYAVPLPVIEKKVVSIFEANYHFNKHHRTSLLLGFDYSNISKERYGLGFSYTYRF